MRKVEVAKIARVSSDSRGGAEIFRGDHITDQVFMPLPRSLTGRSKVDVVVIVDGKTANTVRAAFR
jgi:hypothetical protein